ncbi:hypothetical protein ACE1CD_28030 [Aerosakkonema sp. BLCC-F183]|uniref:hypothetical protein n=1 Tax=Aerosakkonema sp. BLCC-F183 TaxID=3342834 RepID=UPI0035B816AF
MLTAELYVSSILSDKDAISAEAQAARYAVRQATPTHFIFFHQQSDRTLALFAKSAIDLAYR